MNPTPPSNYKSSLPTGVNVVFVIVVLAGYLPVFFEADFWALPMWQAVLLVALGVFYLIMGIYGWDYLIERREDWTGIILYFAVQIIVTTAILIVGAEVANSLWIVFMPLVGQSVGLPHWGTLIINLIILGIIMLLFQQWMGWMDALRNMGGIVAAQFFVIIFSYVAIREEAARQQVQSLANQLGQANQKLREYAVQAEELATTKERNRLAREIHDSLGHYLIVINVQLSAAQAILDIDQVRALDALQKAQSLTQEGLDEVRQSVAALRESPAGERPLPEVITTLVEESRMAGIVTDFTLTGAPRPLDAQTNLTLYRAVQEGLTNARKHARASRIDVALVYGADGLVQLTVTDNGIGADQTEGGFGLLGLQERVNLLGGTMIVETAMGKGFALQVAVKG